MKLWKLTKYEDCLCIVRVEPDDGDRLVSNLEIGRIHIGENIVAAHNAEARLTNGDELKRLLEIIGIDAIPSPLESLLAETPVSAIERGDLSPFHEMEYLHSRDAWAPFRAAAAERVRQIGVHGYDAAHDDKHMEKELVDAALFFALRSRYDHDIAAKFWPRKWTPVSPFGTSAWEPKVNIERAIAMLAAEWSRLDRIEQRHEERRRKEAEAKASGEPS